MRDQGIGRMKLVSLLKTHGLVLKNINFGEADKIITLFSNNLGKIQVLAKGCRKPKSRLLSASQMFCLGEYVLFKGKGSMYILSQCDVQQTFYNLRTNLERLGAASYILNLCQEVIQEQEGNTPLFALTVSCLSLLCYSDTQSFVIVKAFEVKMLSIIGYKPHTTSCVLCSGDLNGQIAFSTRLGGVACEECRSKDPYSLKINHGTLNTLRYIQEMDIKKISRIKIGSNTMDELDRILTPFITQRLEKVFKSKDFMMTVSEDLKKEV
jgi:DNA repair protein RecO (recombination protein O)